MRMDKKEEDIIRYWNDHNILEKIREKNKGMKPFYFLDGPPFVSGDLHPGQMWVKSMKDVILRYKRFRGYDVYDRAGYDVHGLPIEKRAEAQLGITSKKEIETRVGVEKFMKTCSDYVQAYIGRMDKDYARFGISLDFSNPYIPSKMQYMETAWQYLKIINEKNMLYKDKRATPYCTSCGTSVSQGSMEVEYHEDKDPSAFVTFRINEDLSNPKINLGEQLYLLVWTTTPWTLPANVSVAINPEERYVIARIGNRRCVLIKSRIDYLSEISKESAVIESEFYGSELEGIYYINPLEDRIPHQKELRKYHKVILAKELVSSSEGSGIVHIAPGHGLEDYLIGKKNKLPIFSPVDLQGEYTKEAGEYAGLKVPENANERVIDDLKRLNALFHESKIIHSYPHCWRCDTKLIYIATDQWFINIQKVKKKLLNENKKVCWHPEEAMKWQEDVLQSSPDWAISRQRYWGIPIPIWECHSCGHMIVIGSVAELAEAAENKDFVASLKDIHKPYIDNVAVKCTKCGSMMIRVPDVLDVWFDSSIAYRASLTQEQFDSLFPMDFILEAIEQLRGWFSYQLKSSVIVHGKKPFKNVVMHGMMLGSDGREMHKKIGNYVPLEEILKTVTADSFRLWCVSHTPQLDLVFNMDKIVEANKVIMLMHNISNLIAEYSNAVSYKPGRIKKPTNPDRLSLEDAWIASRLNLTIKEVTESLDNYEIYKAANAIRSFVVMDFSRFYLKMAKKKALYSGRKESKAALDMMNYVLYNIAILLSPITPFASEMVYMERYGFRESIFLEDWPKCRQKSIRKDIDMEFEVAIDAITALLNCREKVNAKLRLPLAKATIEVNNEASLNALGKLSSIMEDYTNIKTIVVKMADGKKNLEIRPLFAHIGPDFKENSGLVAEELKRSDPNEVADSIAKSGEYLLHTDKGVFAIRNNHFTMIEKLEKEDAISFKYGIAYVDREISNELKEEGMLREFERRVQLARKEVGLKKGDRIRLQYRVSAEMNEVLEKNVKKLMHDVGARLVSRSDRIDMKFEKEFDVDGEKIRIGIEKLTP